MRIFVQYDQQGRIIAIAKVEAIPQGQEHPFADALEEGVASFEIKSLGELKDVEPIDIHEQYVVDVERKELIKKRS